MHVLKKFASQDSGNVAVLFALVLVPFIVLIGLAVDTNRRDAASSELQSAIDAAVLAYVVNANQVDPEAYAKLYFQVNASQTTRSYVEDVKFSFIKDADTNLASAKGTFTAKMPSLFGGVVGIKTLNLGGLSKASKSLVNKIDFHILADTSDSMGLAATSSEQSKLKSLTTAAASRGLIAEDQKDCAFACHASHNGKASTLSVARGARIDLRIDVAKRGIKRLIDKSESSSGVQSRYAINTFNSSYFTVAALTEDLSQATNAANLLEVGFGMPNSQDANTNFPGIVGGFVDQLKTHISSLPANDKPEQIVVLISDGLKSQGNGIDAGTVEPFQATDCEKIKSTGAKLAVIYTEYVPMPDAESYRVHASAAVPLLENALKACASPGLYAKGNTPQEIDDAFEVIFAKVSTAPRLTN